MSFTTAKSQVASNRFQLIRIEPAVYVNDDLSLSGSDYIMTFTATNVSKVTRNDTELTEVTTITGNDEWTYDESTGAFAVRLAAAPSSSNVICLYFYLFYTGEKQKALPETPDNSSTQLRAWEPRVTAYVATNQSISNVTTGVLTYADTGFTLANADRDFERYLTIDASFSNKIVDVWQCIDSVDNIEKIYHGRLKNISLTGSTVTMEAFDPFTKLSENPYMGDEYDYVKIVKQPIIWPMIYEGDNFNAIPYIFGSSSPHDLYETQIQMGTPPANYWINSKSVYHGTCYDYTTQAPATNLNRAHMLCRVDSAGLKTLDFGTTVRVASGGSSMALYYLSGHNLQVGDRFEWSAGTYYAQVDYVGDFTSGGLDYNVAVSGYGTTSTWPADLSALSAENNAPILWMIDPSGSLDPIRLWPSTHFTWTTISAGTNLMISIDLLTNAESTWGGTVYDPTKHKIGYVVRPATQHTHGEALKLMIESCGLTTNAASFTAADAALSANAFFTIPFRGSTVYEKLRDYVEALTRSTMGYVKINTSNEVEYNLLGVPTSTDSIDNTLYNTISTLVDYNDIVHEISAQNKHAISTEKLSGSDTNSSYAKATNNKARYLHGINKTDNFEHVLESIADRIDDILAVRSSRRARYSFTTATHNLDSEIGDDILLTSNKILGGASTDQLKITSITKNSHTAEVEADDLGELT